MKENNPLSNMLKQSRTLLNKIVFKDAALANKYETLESKRLGNLYKQAKLLEDEYFTYKSYWSYELFQEINPTITIVTYNRYISDPHRIPLKYRSIIREKGRNKFLSEYKETNNYYRMLIGLPDIDDNDYLFPSEDICNTLNIPNSAIHLLSTFNQTLYMQTDEYHQLVLDNPDKKYLNYIGTQKVDLFTARNALDFDIIRYPLSDPDINPILLESFANTYSKYRTYIMEALYNEHLADLYVGYREFIGLLIKIGTLLQTFSSSLEGINTHQYIDENLTYNLFSLYGIPESIIMNSDVRRSLSRNLLKLVQNRGTSRIYYDLASILGYTEVTVSKLLLLRNKGFDTNQCPSFIESSDNLYDDIRNKNLSEYKYEDIINGDQEWWDTKEVRDILSTNNYVYTNSQYITLNGTIYQSKSLFETLYFARMVLDNKSKTQTFEFEIPELLGSTKVSVYDATLFIICVGCLISNLSGNLNSDSEDLFATSGFNFEYDRDLLEEFISNSKYLEKEKIRVFLDKISIVTINDLYKVFIEVLSPLRTFLEDKIVSSDNREEFLEYEILYRSLFTYDITRNSFLDDFKSPIEIVRNKYSISEDDLLMFKSFYPHDIDGRTIKKNELSSEINNTRYHYPFLDNDNKVTWYIDLGDRGILYLYDILNSDNCLELTNENGNRLFMDWFDDEWVLNESVVQLALSKIDALDSDELNRAFIQVKTPVLNHHGLVYDANTLLPKSIRNINYKNILHDKLALDLNGFATLPSSYFECLYRDNFNLYSILLGNDRFNNDKERWLKDVMIVIESLEKAIGMQLKYTEESIIGKEMYFKPLIAMINHFKSMLVKVARTNLTYIFDDKLDIGGNSNLLKFFDSLDFIIHFSTLSGSGYESNFGLYDANKYITHNIILRDYSTILRDIVGTGFLAQERFKQMGSLYLSDECLLSVNGNVDRWYAGIPNSGRYDNELETIIQIRNGRKTIRSSGYDLEGWQDYVESLSPIE